MGKNLPSSDLFASEELLLLPPLLLLLPSLLFSPLTLLLLLTLRPEFSVSPLLLELKGKQSESTGTNSDYTKQKQCLLLVSAELNIV